MNSGLTVVLWYHVRSLCALPLDPWAVRYSIYSKSKLFKKWYYTDCYNVWLLTSGNNRSRIIWITEFTDICSANFQLHIFSPGLSGAAFPVSAAGGWGCAWDDNVRDISSLWHHTDPSTEKMGWNWLLRVWSPALAVIICTHWPLCFELWPCLIWTSNTG